MQGYKQMKRAPNRPFLRPNEIAVSSRSNEVALFKRAWKLLFEEGCQEIHIHALGSAIELAVNIALKLNREAKSSLQIEVTTSTVPLIDDFVPTESEKDKEIITQIRYNSAIHIKISIAEGHVLATRSKKMKKSKNTGK